MHRQSAAVGEIDFLDSLFVLALLRDLAECA